MMLDIVLAISLLSSALAVPQPLPTPVDTLPTLSLADFAKSTKKVTGTKTTLKVDDTSGGGAVTRIINKTVTTTGKYRGSKQKPALVTGKLAGIIIGVVIGVIILLVLAIFLYKRRQKKRALLNSESPEAEAGGEAEEGHGEKVDPNEVGSLPIVQGEMGYKEEPANSAPVPAPRSNPVDTEGGTIQGLPPTSLSKM